MKEETINYKGINIKNELYPIIKYIEDVDKYKDELGTLNSSWDILSLLGQLGDINIDIGKTKENFLNLTSTLLNHLAIQQIKKVTQEMNFKSQVAIDILIRNLFERRADIGFLATDDDIRLFLENFVSIYDDNSLLLKQKIQKRFKEYVSKYSVYFDIVLFNTYGRVVVRLNEDINIEKVDLSFIQKVLNTSDEYVESYQYHDFIPKYQQSLVYSYKVTKENSSENIGVLSLCFKFKNEMKVIFNNLINKNNKECLTILDKDGYVIATSDKEHINFGVQLPIILNESYKIISFNGRDYMAKTSQTSGYQGFYGPKWYGHIMIPLEYAFLSISQNALAIDEKVIHSMIKNEQHFPKELKDVFENSQTIQDNLTRVIWNGNIIQSKQNSSNRAFSKALLNEIGVAGNKASLSLDNLNQTIVTSILKDCEFLSQLAIDIMDRNLYERANDCRWWALTPKFREILSKEICEEKDKKDISNILAYINGLYTVYTNIIVYDNSGKIIAVSKKEYGNLVGNILNEEWLHESLLMKNSQMYRVSKFEKSKLYNNEHTYIYSSSILSSNNKEVVGGIAVVFDSYPQFKAILNDILPSDINSFALFANKDKSIISSTKDDLIIGSLIQIKDEFFNLKNGESHSGIVELNNKYYAVGSRCSFGYREYKINDGYKNDVISLIFTYLCDKKESNISNTFKIFNQVSYEKDNTSIVEYGTFFIQNYWYGINTKELVGAVGIEQLQHNKQNEIIAGRTFYENELVEVIDLHKYLNIKNSENEQQQIVILRLDDKNKTSFIGIIVDALGAIVEVPSSNIQKAESLHFKTDYFVKEICKPPKENNTLLSIIEPKELLNKLWEYHK
mgnify:CR=1 FL=1